MQALIYDQQTTGDHSYENESGAVFAGSMSCVHDPRACRTGWDNALINFDQKTRFPAGNYVVMKLWRDAFAPGLLAVEGPDRPLNFVATPSADKRTVFFKAVNPHETAVQTAVRINGDLTPRSATMQLVAPGGETVENTLEEPDNIKVVDATATVEGRTVTFTMPPLSAGVVRVGP